MDNIGLSKIRRRRARLDPHGFAVKVALGVGLFLLAVTAVVFSGSSATRDTAASGLAAVHAEAALGANDVAFRALAQFVLLDEDRLLGVADSAVVEKAADEALQAIEEVGNDIAALIAVKPDTAPDISAAYSDVQAATSEVLAAADDGVGTQVLSERARPRFELLRDALVASREQHADSLFTENDLAGRMNLISRFLVALVLPLGAIVTYRVAAMRQIRLAEVQLDAQLDAEQEIHRAKDEFIANLSHELRTPLTSIYGFSEVLIEGGMVDPETAADLIRLINSESAELGRMVEDLLVSARASAGALTYAIEEVDLRSEVDAVVTPLARTGSDVDVDLPGEPVRADPLRARQIVRNLVSNAIRHGGPTVQVRGSVQDDRLVVAVIDDGEGVPDEMARRLFSRFVHDGRAALTEGSVGLGLAVVKELCEAMGGGIDYRRQDGSTVFEFWLPLAHTIEEPPALQVAGSDPWAG